MDRTPVEAEDGGYALSEIFEAIPDPLIVLDRSLHLVYINQAARAAGLIFNEEGGAQPRLAPLVRAELAPRIERTQKARGSMRFDWSSPGEATWFNVSISTAADLVSVSFRDVSVERRALGELQRSERRYRELVEGSFDVVALMTTQWTFLDVNRRWEDVSGYTPAELIGTDLLRRLLTSDSRQRLSQAIKARPGEVPPLERFDVDLVDKAGRRHRIEMSCRVIREPNREQVVEIVGRDITDRQQLADRLQRAQKLEAVGRLAGGIAHDFNNVLLVVRGGLGLLSPKLDDPDAIALLDEIQRESDRATALVRQLLAFARRQVLQPETLELNEIVTGLQEMLARLVGGSSELILHLSPEVQHIRGDQSQVEQVLLNLVLNARDAISDVGTITIETSRRTFSEDEQPSWGECKPGDYVTLAVRDTGDGMEPELQSMIFEPFFTSRGEENSGLGLATVYGIVTQMRGGIDVVSAPGQGAAFTVYLPRLSESLRQTTTARVDRPAPQPAHTETATVLLVEDDQGPRQILEKMLSTLGYEVVVASRGQDALELLDTASPKVDLLLTDVVMPEMSGPELAERVLERRPGIPVIFMTGYSESTGALKKRLARGEALLKKPFSAADLAAEIHRALNRVRAEREL